MRSSLMYGTYFLTGPSSSTLPSATSWSVVTATNDFVMLPTRTLPFSGAWPFA